jgi:muramidase (phage lysozyme)
MAHGFLQATDLRTERNYLGNIASAIGNRIGKASDMARRERAYAESIAEKNNTSLSEAGIGRGHFFQRALGSTFGGDAIARTRGRFAKDATMSIDPTGSQASRFRGGFVDRGRYDYSEEIFSSPAARGGALATIFSSGPSVAQKLLDAGPTAINPEVLGGEIAKYQGSPTTNAAGFTVDTQATEIKDIAGILNQIGQLMVRTNNNTIQAVDSVQKVNVKVVESIQSLGQLQVGIAERQIQNQRLLASNAENTAEKIASRQLAASEKANMAQQRVSSGDLDPEGSGMEGPQGGILGSMFGALGNVLDTGLNLLGGRRGGRRGLGRMSRAGRAAQRRQGFSTAMDGDVGIRGMNFRDTTTTGNTLSRSRIRAGTAGKDVYKTAQKDITKRYAQRYGEKAALKRFGAESLEAAGMGLTKGARVMRFLSPVLKRVPIVGGLLDFGISLALGEPVGRAAAKAIGATLGAGLGSFVPIPGVGTILGGIAGDLVGGAIYDALAGGSGGTETAGPTPFAAGGIITQPTNALMGEAGAEGVFPLEGAKGRKTFLQFGEGILEAQKQNKKLSAEIQARGLAEYFDKKPWWEKFIEGLKKILPGWMGGNNDDRNRRNPNPGGGGGDIDVSKLAGDTPEAKAWLAAINATEAGGPNRYNTLVGGEVVPELTQMTMQEVYDMAYGSSIGEGYLPERFGGRRVTYGADSHAAGAFQFHPDTMMARVRDAGMDPNTTLFTPENQQKLALAHLMNLGVDPNKAMDSASLAKAGSMAGWQGLSVENGHITEAGALRLYADMLQRANNGNANGMGDLNTTNLSPEAVQSAIEALGGDPSAPLNTPTITGPQTSNPFGDLLAKSAQTDAQARALQMQPMAFTLPMTSPGTQSNDGQQGFAFGLATAGSSGMGTDPFSSLGLMTLK